MHLLPILAQASDNSGGFFVGIGVTWLLLALLAGIFWLWMLIHALTNNSLDTVMKLVWAVIIFVLPFLGALAYFFIGRNPGRASG